MPDEPLTLDATAELAGEWWHPDDREATAYGLLNYSPEDGLTLRLTSGRDIVSFVKPAPWLQGLTVDGRRVTLRNLIVTSWHFHSPGGIDARAWVGQAFVGMHAASDRELSMMSLQARMVNLSEWLGITGLDVTTFQSQPRQFSYNHPNEVGLGRINGALMVATFEPVGEIAPPRTPFTLTFEQRAWFAVRVARHRRFDELHTLIARFNAFLCLAAGIDSPTLELIGTARIPIEEMGTGRISHDTRPVWVLFQPLSLPTKPRPADQSSSDWTTSVPRSCDR